VEYHFTGDTGSFSRHLYFDTDCVSGRRAVIDGLKGIGARWHSVSYSTMPRSWRVSQVDNAVQQLLLHLVDHVKLSIPFFVTSAISCSATTTPDEWTGKRSTEHARRSCAQLPRRLLVLGLHRAQQSISEGKHRSF